MNHSEAALLKGARRLDLDALTEIYDRYNSELYQYAVRMLGDACQAEDCVAETFARFLKALQAGQGPQDYLKAYLYRVAHNWISDFYRRQAPPPLELDEDFQGGEATRLESQVEQRLLREEMRAALLRLTPDQRQVVMLRYIEGWENDVVAAALQKPVSAVKSLQHRALAALRRLLVREEKEALYG